jgi:signal transduction histidine kinase
MTWWRRRSLRVRLMLTAVCGLVAGLTLGSVALVAALRYGLERSVDSELLATADSVAQMVVQETLPEVVPVTGAQEVQVLDVQGRVLFASAPGDGLVSILRPRELAAARRGERFYVNGNRLAQSGELRVVAVVTPSPQGERTVLVARSVADMTQSLHVLRVVLWLAFPPLVIGLAVLAWRGLGAALRPVEALRLGAEEIATGRAGGEGAGRAGGDGASRAGDGAGRVGEGAGRAGGDGADQLPVPVSGDEIHRLAVTLNDMLRRLAAGRARQREFVADAAHELRSPLANMRTQLEVALQLGDRTDWPAVADDLLTDTERLARLVDDLLLLARMSDSAAPARAGAGEPVELGEMICQVARRYPSPPVRVVPPQQPLWTTGEPDALHRVTANLVDNAVRHARGKVVISADRDGTYHRVTVTDDGPGIPAEDRERVFKRFTRLDDARARDAGGAGLGLAIVRELVRRHGGEVRLEDARPGPGLRAEVRLPVREPVGEQ